MLPLSLLTGVTADAESEPRRGRVEFAVDIGASRHFVATDPSRAGGETDRQEPVEEAPERP